jgi:hypothetical protein
MPIGTVDGYTFALGDGPGPLTARLHGLYWQKAAGWLAWNASGVLAGNSPIQALLQL